MEKQNLGNKKIQLVFERTKQQDVYLPEDKPKYVGKNFFDVFTVNIEEISSWFGNEFKVLELEFTINTILNTQNFTKLFIGNKNETQGVKVVLKPKENVFSNPDLESTKSGV